MRPVGYTVAQLEFFFDCSSPWTYLAFSRVRRWARDDRVDFIWRPILVGGVFNAVNQAVYERRAAPDPRQKAYYDKDLQDWARYCGVRIGMPPVFPVRSVEAMRGAIVADKEGKIEAYAAAVFEAYWGDLRDISQKPVLEEICDTVGLDREKFFAGIAADDTKAQLRFNTESLMERGGFGSPTFFVDKGNMFFGNDRVPLIEAALGVARQE